MKVSYYPGCSLEGTASDYADSLLAISAAFDIELEEIPDWHCCGASAAHNINHRASIELAGNNLALATGLNNENLLVPCPMCFNRLKTAAHAIKTEGQAKYDIEMKRKVPAISGFAEFFATPVMLRKLAEKVVKPLKGLNVVCYYGCMSNRPPEITGTVDYENPMAMEKIVQALGGNAIDWAYKTDCCGASFALSKPDMMQVMVGKLYDMAKRVGADAVVVSCQMCQANLDMYQRQIGERWETEFSFPVYYFSELIGLACKLEGAREWISRHVTESLSLLDRLHL